MTFGFGNELPHPHGNTTPRPRAHFLVAIDSGGFMVARLFLESREQVAEFDASTEEVAQMIMHLQPQGDASDPHRRGSLLRLGRAAERLEELDRDREDDRRVVRRADLEQRLQVAELDRDRLV